MGFCDGIPRLKIAAAAVALASEYTMVPFAANLIIGKPLYSKGLSCQNVQFCAAASVSWILMFQFWKTLAASKIWDALVCR